MEVGRYVPVLCGYILYLIMPAEYKEVILNFILTYFSKFNRVNWPITKQRLVTKHPCSAAAGLC